MPFHKLFFFVINFASVFLNLCVVILTFFFLDKVMGCYGFRGLYIGF